MVIISMVLGNEVARFIIITAQVGIRIESGITLNINDIWGVLTRKNKMGNFNCCFKLWNEFEKKKYFRLKIIQ